MYDREREYPCNLKGVIRMPEFTRQAVDEFIAHVDKSVDNLLDNMLKPNYPLEMFDVKISINGKGLDIPLNADNYEALMAFINQIAINMEE
jgi:hypothetical protein